MHNTSRAYQLTALQAAAPPTGHDPALLHDLLTAAAFPERTKAALITAFDIQALYNKETDQVTIWASLTQDTPAPSPPSWRPPRTDNGTGPTATPAHPPDAGTFSTRTY